MGAGATRSTARGAAASRRAAGNARIEYAEQTRGRTCIHTRCRAPGDNRTPLCILELDPPRVHVRGGRRLGDVVQVLRVPEMRNASVLCLGSAGFHRMHYYDWGDADNPRVLICVHGLTRTGRDFDYLATALQREYRVVCPDVAGRGRSDWLAAKSDYGYAQYAADMTTLIADDDAGVERTIDWIGTSMGALIGIILASRNGSPFRKLVLNDAGMLVP